MQLNRYNELVAREQQLQNEMRKFITDAIDANGGRVSFTPPKEDLDDEDLSMDEIYPIITTLYRRKGEYDIAITDVYINKHESGQVDIMADGVDTEDAGKMSGFLIYPEQFSDIMYFIAFPLLNKIRKYAERLALYDLVDKFDKMPDEIMDEGWIKKDCDKEYRDSIAKYIDKFESLYIKCSESNQDKQDTNAEIMSYCSATANLNLMEKNKMSIFDMIVNDEKGGHLMEERQIEFDNFFNEMQDQLWRLFGFNGVN